MILILGGPGAGKTHALLGEVEYELERGTLPRLIAYCSFTRRAVNEAVTRACRRFDLEERDLPYFRTIHSLCYRALGLNGAQVMDREDYKKIGAAVGLDINGGLVEADDYEAAPRGDRMLFLMSLARAKIADLKDVWEAAREDDISWYDLEQLNRTIARYKADAGKMDFSDMLERFVDRGAPLPVEAAFVDEAQDLTPLQWRVVDLAFRDAERLYFGGDDDQAIFAWSGADIARFLGLAEAAAEVRVLPRSHRLPRVLFDFAAAQAGKIRRRNPKAWGPREEGPPGAVRRVFSLPEVDLGHGSVLCLARNRCFLRAYEDELRTRGVPYETRRGPSVDPAHIRAIRAYEALRAGREIPCREAGEVAAWCGVQLGPGDPSRLANLMFHVEPPIWHDAFRKMPERLRAYYLAALRSGEKLTGTPRVRVETIHGAKGAEADVVVLMTDVTNRVVDGLVRDPDSEYRVFYVGVSRARETLYVLAPQTTCAYPV